MNEHLVQYFGYTADSSPGLDQTPNPFSSSSYPPPTTHRSALSARLRRQKVKVFTALKSLTNNDSFEQSNAGEQSVTSSEGQSTKSTLISGLHKMSNAIIRPPPEQTVVRRASPQSRPLLKETFQEAEMSPASVSGSSGVAVGTSASNTNSGKISALSSSGSHPSTDKTSPRPMFRDRDPNTLGGDGRAARLPTTPSSSRTTAARHSPHPSWRQTTSGTPPSSPPNTSCNNNNNNRSVCNLLDPIHEVPPSLPPPGHHHQPHRRRFRARGRTPPPPPLPPLPQPGVATAERAAAAKIFLETHFNTLLASGPSPRQMRRQMLETELFNRARELREQQQSEGSPRSSTRGSGGNKGTEARAAAEARARFCRREAEHLREVRAMKAGAIRLLGSGGLAVAAGRYETVKVLGKGSFGVVKLVRERGREGRVYAMKVIRKSKMLKTNQEGHLRAERDLLVASEGSRWIVPLVASFQDLSNLYLVMEYMPGGDFLSLLIRENVLHESVARFYVAEIVLCVEAAHSLKCIHRDIKPDNFLISASGHLKISDFGLAFDGHWSHDTTYYNSHR